MSDDARRARVLLVSGAIVMGYAVAGLFFLRFWRETRDRLFLIFAAPSGSSACSGWPWSSPAT